jgi:hypothetical protein
MNHASYLSVLVLLAASSTAGARPAFFKRMKAAAGRTINRIVNPAKPPSMTDPASTAGACRRNIGWYETDANLAGVSVRTLNGQRNGVPTTRAEPLGDMVNRYYKDHHCTLIPTVVTGYGGAVVTNLLGGDPNSGLFFGMIGGALLEPLFAVPGKTARALRPHIALATIARHTRSAKTADLKWAQREALSQKSAVSIAVESAQQAIRQEAGTRHQLHTRDYYASRKRKGKRVETHLRDVHESGRHPALKAAQAELSTLRALETKLGSFATTIGAELDRRERQFTH